MAVRTVLLLLSLVSVRLGNELLKVKCQPAVGEIGQDTHVSCSFESNFEEKDFIISALYVTKRGENDPVFWISPGGVKGDPRFKLPSVYDPSLLITNTAVSDEGWYDSTIITNRGVIQDGTFQISVTAPYSLTSSSSRPEKLVEGGPVKLHCNASGGYPAGTIRWNDSTNTDWTRNAELKITEGEDKLVHMSSTLSFKSIDSSWGQFRCEVLNSKGVMEGNITFPGFRDYVKGSPTPPTDPKMVSIVAGVMVIVLVVGAILLVAFWYRSRHTRREEGCGDLESPEAESPLRAVYTPQTETERRRSSS